MINRSCVQIGERFNRVEVIDLLPGKGKGNSALAIVRCDCGTEKTVQRQLLRHGKIQSCGNCGLQQEAARKAKKKHGESAKTPEYTAWKGIITRCFNPNFKQFDDYGGRGITMCSEWRSNYRAFVDHVGRRPSSKHSIDRIDNNGNYEPANVRWATRIEQSRNRRNVNL